MKVSDPAVRRPSTGKPVFCMVGIDADRGMCRLYASRDLKDLNWGMRDRPDYTTAWHVDASMQHVLVIDKPTWGECFAKAFEIWDNEDRNANEVEAARQSQLNGGGKRKALDEGRRIMAERKALASGTES